MINKQNLWFVTLFSLIMVLSIYYLSMGDDKLAKMEIEAKKNSDSQVVISEADELVALKVEAEESLTNKLEELQNVLLNETATLEEKNNAYEELQTINKNESEKEKIEKLVKETYKLDNLVKIEGNNITITVSSKEHDTKLANNIIRSVQELYNEEKYITIKFNY